jgi:hypothetical protein
MAPSVVQNVTQTVSDLSLNPLKAKTLIKEPLKSSGSLDQFPQEDLTPALGTEFSTATQLSQLLKADNADELIRDLAILSIPKHHPSLILQSPNEVSCFSVIRISISQLKSYLEPNLESYLASLQPPNCTPTLSSTPPNSVKRSA